MDSIPSSEILTTESFDFSPLFGLTINDHPEHLSSSSLVEQLQTTLDIEQLLEIFSMEAAKMVRFCGLTLDFADNSVAVRGSMPGKHRFSFNIAVENKPIAQLSYSLIDGLNRHSIRQLETLHQQLAYPLRNAIAFFNVKKQALRDHLTGVGNRGHFDDSLFKAMMHAKRKRSTFALIMLDLDNFKQVNDNYGHQTGDQVIKEFAAVLRQSIRTEDNIFRFGGDEFAIIADSKDDNEAHSITARVQHNVSNNPVMRKYGVSTSIGFTFFRQNDGQTELYSRADSALYAAKDFGRNCTKTA